MVKIITIILEGDHSDLDYAELKIREVMYDHSPGDHLPGIKVEDF